MGVSNKKRNLLLSAIIRLVVVMVFVYVIIVISKNAIVTNEVALGQLNGGNEAYLAQEIYYKYKSIAPYIGAGVIIWGAIPLIKIIYKHIIKKSKEKTNEKH